MEKTAAESNRFDHKQALILLKQLNDDKDKIDVRLFHDLCKMFTKMSASMGSLVAWGFDGSASFFSERGFSSSTLR